MFKGCFINLDRSTDRRQKFEQLLAQVGAAGRYERFAAVDGRAVAGQHKTTLDPGALGAYLSHLGVWTAHRSAGAHLHVTEDDITLPNAIASLLDNLLPLADAELKEWDVLYTEVMVPVDLASFASMEALLREAQSRQRILFVPLTGGQFAGMTSYVVNRSSIDKLIGLMEPGIAHGVPVDLFIRQAIANGQLKAFVTVPFLTTVSEEGDASDIRGATDRSRRVMNCLRRAFYIGTDHDALLQQMRSITQDARTAGLRGIYAEAIRFICSDQYVEF